jgi:crossover junction endodeoxyribonuclease RusA
VSAAGEALPPLLPGLGTVESSRWVLVLPYEAPPLTENQRLNRYDRARRVKTLRGTTGMLARAAHIPALGRCRVTLTWFVRTTHRRDADNVVPTLKAACDGLVDAGVVADDTPDLMAKLMPVITYRPGVRQSLVLLVEAVAP